MKNCKHCKCSKLFLSTPIKGYKYVLRNKTFPSFLVTLVLLPTNSTIHNYFYFNDFI